MTSYLPRAIHAHPIRALALLLVALLLASEQSFAQDQFINRWKPSERLAVTGSTPVSDDSRFNGWIIEPVDATYVRIKNQVSGSHLHNENGALEVGFVQDGWWSAMWELEPVGNFVRIKNRWTGTYLHNENGALEIGEIESGWWSAMWIRERPLPSLQEAFGPLSSARLQEINAPRKNASGRQFELSAGNHVNGMARIGDWYIVNYGNVGGEQGRIIFWEEGADDYATPHWYATDGGKPEHMGAAGDYLAVATTGGTHVKFFDFSNPRSGVSEIANAELEDGGGNLGFTYCPDRNRYYVLTGWGTMTLHESNAATLEATTSWREVGKIEVPTAEAGFPIVRLSTNEFVVVSLGAGEDGSDNPYEYRLTSLTLSGTAGSTTVASTTDPTYFALTAGPAGGAPSFRWGGTVRMESGNHLAFYAAPKRLDASGNYYKWSAGQGAAGDMKVTIIAIKCTETTELGEDEVYLTTNMGTRLPAGNENYRDMDDGDEWQVATTVTSDSDVEITLMEYDTSGDRDRIGIIYVPIGEAEGWHTETLTGDGGEYDITYSVSY